VASIAGTAGDEVQASEVKSLGRGEDGVKLEPPPNRCNELQVAESDSAIRNHRTTIDEDGSHQKARIDD
jgi:hypothetical protein